MNNQNPNIFLNLEEPFPKPPSHYIQEQLIPPKLEVLYQINPEFHSFGKTYKVNK